MSDFMLLGILRMPIEADDGVVAFTQFRSAARSAADRIKQLTAERDMLREALEPAVQPFDCECGQVGPCNSQFCTPRAALKGEKQ